MKLMLSDIAQQLNGQLAGADLAITGVGIDTRTLKAGDLYVAIKGHQFDGHDFIERAEQADASAILVAQPVNSNLPQIIVTDSRLALAQLAGYWRKLQSIKVVGVTGSNGKTTIKEMLAAILSTQGNTLATQGNLNNNIGVPLTLLRLTEQHRYAVIEMGANHPGEIAYTSQFAQADVSIISNVGTAHIEGFGSITGVAQTKGEIIASLATHSVAVLNRDDQFYDYWLNVAGNRKTVSFGFHVNADVRADNIQSQLQSQGFVTEFDLNVGELTQRLTLNLAGEHNVKNALAATAAALQLGIAISDIQTGLAQLKPVTGRMQPLLGRKGNLVIDDTYNANPSSLQAALNAVPAGNDSTWLVLGAFGELGADSANIHHEMGAMIKAAAVKRLFATGSLTRQTVAAFGSGAEYYENQEQLIQALNQAITGQETILVKGSRSQKMENVVAALVDNFRAA